MLYACCTAQHIQGLGKTTREARCAAATAALSKLTAAMPGLSVLPGTLPPTWSKWIAKNVTAGASPAAVLSRLLSKGFQPALNPALMQKLVALAALRHSSSSSSSSRYNSSSASSSSGSDSRGLGVWIDDCLQLGLDGAVLAELVS
jgi:hypothetical protein